MASFDPDTGEIVREERDPGTPRTVPTPVPESTGPPTWLRDEAFRRWYRGQAMNYVWGNNEVQMLGNPAMVSYIAEQYERYKTTPQYAIDHPETPPPVAGQTPPPAAGQTPPPAAGQTPTTMAGWQAWFEGLSRNLPHTPASLVSLEAQMAPYGVTILRNASGVAGKIKLPDGTIVDVITAANDGGTGWWWNPGTGSDSSSSSSASAPDASMQGFGTQGARYTSTPWTGGTGEAPPLPENLQSPYVAPVFTGPTQAEAELEPGYLTRMAAGQRTLEASAAAKGTILSGGTQKALARYGQEYGANEYNSVYNRALQTFGTNAALGLGERQQNASEYGTLADTTQQNYKNRYAQWLDENSRSLTEFATNAGTQRNWETDYWSRLMNLYQGGQSAASNSYQPGVA